MHYSHPSFLHLFTNQTESKRISHISTWRTKWQMMSNLQHTNSVSKPTSGFEAWVVVPTLAKFPAEAPSPRYHPQTVSNVRKQAPGRWSPPVPNLPQTQQQHQLIRHLLPLSHHEHAPVDVIVDTIEGDILSGFAQRVECSIWAAWYQVPPILQCQGPGSEGCMGLMSDRHLLDSCQLAHNLEVLVSEAGCQQSQILELEHLPQRPSLNLVSLVSPHSPHLAIPRTDLVGLTWPTAHPNLVQQGAKEYFGLHVALWQRKRGQTIQFYDQLPARQPLKLQSLGGVVSFGKKKRINDGIVDSW